VLDARSAQPIAISPTLWSWFPGSSWAEPEGQIRQSRVVFLSKYVAQVAVQKPYSQGELGAPAHPGWIVGNSYLIAFSLGER
jgi:hypothetical protein